MQRFLVVLFLATMLLFGTSLAQDATPSPTATTEPPINLRIWFPDTLALSGDNSIHATLYTQSQAFIESQENILPEYRLKAVGSVGGIMSTLRNARNVAPAALPTITLMRRQDLIVAQREGLIQSLEGGIASSLQSDLNNVLALGQINGDLYGLPYMLELSSIVYRPQENVDYSEWTYQAVLERNLPYIFPAGRISGLSDVFYLQYLISGGRLNPDGSLALNQEALETNFAFYEAASDLGLLNGFSLNYSNTSAYLSEFQSGNYDAAVFNSSIYLQLYAEDDSLEIAPIPNETGAARSIVNSWMWVIVTENPQERAVALDYLAWMMESNRQIETATAVYSLPSRQTSLESLATDLPISLYLDMLESPILPLNDGEAGSLGTAMQTAFASILTLESNAEDALQSVIQSQSP